MGFYMFLGIWLFMFWAFSVCKDSDEGMKVSVTVMLFIVNYA